MSGNQLNLWSDSGYGSVQAVNKSQAKNDRNEVGELPAAEGPDSLLITVVIKQLGFYGCQSQFTVKVHSDSDLLRAMDKERTGSKALVEHVLDWLSKSVLSSILPLVSGVSDARRSSRSRVAK